MTYSSLSKSAAYDQARHEFYAERLKEDIERRVAVEEAQSTGAYFGLSYLQIGMQLEDKTYEEWKLWALKDTLEQEQRRAAKYSGNDGAAGPQEAEKEEDGGVEEALDELDAAVVAAAS